MLKTLRNRLILSHILPLLIIIPLMGIGFIYVLETQVYLPALSNELGNDAQFMAQLTALDTGIWNDPSMAQALVNLHSTRDNTAMMLLDPTGMLIAASDPSDQEKIGQVLDGLDLSSFPTPVAGETYRQFRYNQRQGSEIIEIVVPVSDPNGQLLGYVRMVYPFASLSDEIYQLRFMIISLLVLGLLLGSGIGYILAVSVSNPVREITQAISALAHTSQMTLLNVYGPEEIQSLSQSVNDLVNRLRDMEQSRQKLLANLVHEIGRPLGALRSATTALAHGAEKEPGLYQDLIQGMDGEIEILQRLLNDLSGLHDQVLGTLELDRQPIQLETWLPGCMHTWQLAAREKGILWELRTDQELPLIMADPTRLAQILGNLASNAVKFTPTGGAISIRALARPGQAGIAIRDTGPGMSLEEIEKIFHPFYRGAHGRRFPQGMGLGLSIAREFTKAHGGELTVESNPGSGSCFTVWLPAQPAVLKVAINSQKRSDKA